VLGVHQLAELLEGGQVGAFGGEVREVQPELDLTSTRSTSTG